MALTEKQKVQEFVKEKHNIEMKITQMQHYVVEILVREANLTDYDMLRNRIKDFAGVVVTNKDIDKAVEKFLDNWLEVWPS
jgi:hypothetical protein